MAAPAELCARPYLEVLCGTQEGYVAAVTEAANTLVAQRLLLQRDASIKSHQPFTQSLSKRGARLRQAQSERH